MHVCFEILHADRTFSNVVQEQRLREMCFISIIVVQVCFCSEMILIDVEVGSIYTQI